MIREPIRFPGWQAGEAYRTEEFPSLDIRLGFCDHCWLQSGCHLVSSNTHIYPLANQHAHSHQHLHTTTFRYAYPKSDTYCLQYFNALQDCHNHAYSHHHTNSAAPRGFRKCCPGQLPLRSRLGVFIQIWFVPGYLRRDSGADGQRRLGLCPAFVV